MGRSSQARSGARGRMKASLGVLSLALFLALGVSAPVAAVSASTHPFFPAPEEPIGPWLTPPSEVIAFSLTPMYFLSFERSRLPDLAPSAEEDVTLNLQEGIEGLARHLDGKNTVLTLLLGEGAETEIGSLRFLADLSRGEEIILQLGDVASLVARLDFLAGFMQYVVHSLLNADTPLTPLEEEITLVFNLEGNGLSASAGVTAEVGGPGLFPFGDGSEGEAEAPLGIREITVRISNGTIRSEAELDPADFTIKRGQMEVQFQLGPNTITSTTVFTKGEGLQKEILVITAQLGDLSLRGQATWAGDSREFKLEATLAGLISFSTLLTPQGLLEPTLGLELRF